MPYKQSSKKWRKVPSARGGHLPKAPAQRPSELVPTSAAPVRRALKWKTKAGLFAAGTAATGGTAYLHHRMKTRKTVSKLYNPFTDETVEFAKADFPDALHGTPMIGRTRRVSALVPTGKHVSHVNALTCAHPKGGGRRMSRTHSPLLRVTKADNGPKMSRGREAAGTVFGPLHSVAAARKGKRLRATGRSAAYEVGGVVPGEVAAGALASRGHIGAARAAKFASSAGGYTGHYRALRQNNRRGYYRPEESVHKTELFHGGVELTPAFSHSGVYPAQAGSRGTRIQ